MKVKVLREFLGVPRGTIGEVVKINNPDWPSSSCEIKFDCKTEPVLIQYPFDPFCEEVIE